MTREEAINEIKSWDFLEGKEIEAIHTLIPELRESEDERIRKAIIDALYSHTNSINILSSKGYSMDDVIAYLEKQKENANSFTDGVIEVRSFQRGLEEGRRLETQKEPGIKWLKSDNVKNPDKPYVDKAGMFYTTDGRMCYASEIEKQKEQKPVKMEVYEVGKGTTVCGQDYKCKKDYKVGNCWYIKDAIYHCGRDGYLTDQNGISWSCTPEWFNEYIQSNTEWAEEEKTRFVSGQFLQCKLSFDSFKEGEHYWLEYVGDDMYVGRSDNVLGQRFHITPRQLYTLFSQKLEEVQGPPQEEKQVSLTYEPPFNENPSDKEIIEALIKHLKEQDGFLTAINCVSTKAILSWLEKQKEQKHPNGCFTCDEYKKGYEEGRRNGFTAGYNKAMKEVEQKEQKPISFNEPYNPNDYDVILDGNVTSLKRKEHFRDDTENVEQKPINYEAELKKCKDNPLYFYDKYVSVKQKPVEYLSKDKVYTIMSKLTKLSTSNLIPFNSPEYKKINEITSDVRSLLDYPIEQKPAERSLEDDHIIGFVYDLLNEIEWKEDWAMSKDECLRLLSNYIPEKSAEWSEEDEEMLNSCISSIEEAKENRYAYKETDGDTSYDHEINWLKSLRPQPKDETYKEKDEAFKLGKQQLALAFMNYLDKNRPEGKMSLSNSECEDIDKAFRENDWAKIMRYVEKYRPSWKPSEEQMKALLNAEGFLRAGLQHDSATTIAELYEQLKKL